MKRHSSTASLRLCNTSRLKSLCVQKRPRMLQCHSLMHTVTQRISTLCACFNVIRGQFRLKTSYFLLQHRPGYSYRVKRGLDFFQVRSRFFHKFIFDAIWFTDYHRIFIIQSATKSIADVPSTLRPLPALKYHVREKLNTHNNLFI